MNKVETHNMATAYGSPTEGDTATTATTANATTSTTRSNQTGMKEKATMGATTTATNNNNNNNASAALPKCVCSWKNCRAYQKAFREVKHPVFDGVVKIKLIQDHVESMAYKDCLDRTLGVPPNKQPEWKPSAKPGAAGTCKYIVARHHFTEKHIVKYDVNPKAFSFVKPFSIHGAKKYLHSINPEETLPGDPGDDNSNKLYMQCPNVPKDVVKAEFHKAMETVRQKKQQRPPIQKPTTKKLSGSSFVSSQADSASKSVATSASQYAMLKSKEAENKMLKDQLEAMKSQLTFLHDMVVKLQEQHFDQGSMGGGRSRKSTSKHQPTTTTTTSQKPKTGGKSTKKGRTSGHRNQNSNNNTTTNNVNNNTNATSNIQNQNPNKNNNNNNNNNPNNMKNSSRHSQRSGSGVPEWVIGDDGNDGESQTQVSHWHDGEGDPDWTESQYESDDDSSSASADDTRTIATTGTFKSKYKLRPGEEPSEDSDEEDEEEDDDEDYMDDDDFDAMTLGASTIVSASKSIKTLPREIELEEDDENSDSRESLEEEAFDNRSFASSHYRGSLHGGSLHGGSSFVSSVSSHHSRKNSIHPNQASNRSVGPGGKKPYRRRSNDSNNQDTAPRPNNRRRSVGSTSAGSSQHTNGTYQVTNMVVTDPYGEKGSYTGSISTSTGMPNGYGRLEYERAGRWYEGDWKHGRWTGQGRLSNGDGDLYEGGLKNDHKHGHGVMQFADGRTFEGEYVNGQMVQGKMTYQDGSTYEGSWVDGMRHGFGRCVFTDESIYEGEFKEGEFYGRGTMTWNDGGWYEGEWLNGEMHGRGREIRADGSLRHDGEWVRGQPIRNHRRNPM